MSAVIDRVRTDRRVAIGLVVAALFLVAWIAWAVYVWNENGSDAGLGVLVSWPALLAALALIASPFVAVAWLLRNREEGAADTAEGEGEEDDEAPDDEASGDEEGSDEDKAEAEAEAEDEDDADGEEDDGEDEAAEAETEEKPAATSKAKAKPKKS